MSEDLWKTRAVIREIAKIGSLLLVLACLSYAQSVRPNRSADNRHVQASPAFAEVLLRTTELQAEVESLLLDYTEEYPKIKEIRSELELLTSESDRLMAVKPADTARLTGALGKLILAKVSNQAKLIQLRLQYADAHPSVKRQRRKVEIYEAAIKQILD